MAYYGGGPAPHMYPGHQGPPQQMYGNQGPPGPQHPGMYEQGDPSQGHFNEYSNNMHPSYGQQPNYYEPQQQQQMYNSPAGQAGHQNPGMGAPMDQRRENTKILRNPFPEVSKDVRQKRNDVYDPSFPTGPVPAVGPGQFNQHRVAPPPPTISNLPSGVAPPVSMAGPPGGVHSAGPMYNNGPGMPSNTRNMASGNDGMFGNDMYGNNGPHHSHHQPAQAPGMPENYQQFASAPFGNNTNNNAQQVQQEPAKSKMQVMTGIVTHVKPGSFGMVSEEIFFQEHVVSGPLPQVGDKVVVEAEAVNGMPFKFNAKRVTKLDLDLADKNTAPPPQALQQQQQQQPQQPFPNRYQNAQPPEHYQNPVPPAHHFQSNMLPMNDPRHIFEQPNYGPLPSLPDSLNLPKPVPPPNLAAVLPTSSANSNPPLKSILKRKGSPTMKRNPPPPPVISKNADKGDLNPFKSSAPSSLKQNVFSVDLDRDIPRVLPPQGSGPPIEFPEYTFFNRERPRSPPVIPAPPSPRITRLLPRSPIPEFGGRRSNSTTDDLRAQRRERSRSRDRTPPRGYRSRSKSPKGRSNRRSRSRSGSPRRLRRSRSRSASPSRRRRYSRSPSPISRRRSRSVSPRNRRRSRSDSPKHRRRTSRSTSRDRGSDAKSKRNYRVRRSRSRSPSRSPYRTRFSPAGDRRRSRSMSPPSQTGLKVFEETVTHGIVVKRVSSDLFPTLNKRSDEKPVEIIRRDTKGKSVIGPVAKTSGGGPPAPIKFQIANSAKSTPAAAPSMVPNPTFKAANMVPPTYLENPVYGMTKTIDNSWTEVKGKKKKPKEQEPAFRVVENTKPQSNDAVSKASSDDKIKQWEAERQSLKSKTVESVSTSDNLLKNPVNILQLKQTIQNDLHELRSKGQSDPGKKLLENPVDIQKLKQTVQRDLQQLKTKESTQSSAGAKEKNGGDGNSPVINKSFDENVEQRLRDLRSKFESHIKEAKSSAAPTTQKKATATTSKPSTATTSKVSVEKQTVSLVAVNLKDKNNAPGPKFPNRQPSENSSERSRGPPQRRNGSPPPIELPPYDEQMERLQEEIHQQRFMDEEQRLKMNGDQKGLHQLYYMEDRRRRRMDERHLARIRMTEIKLKKDKMFGELARLREEWGPPQQRLEQERDLRQMRVDEERQEHQLQGQAEAIRRQEIEYQRWLEEEAASRSRNMQNSARASRGCEGRVLRRRTPSPSSQRNPPSHNHGPPPPDPRGPHHSRRRSRSPSFERYKEDWHRRHPRDRSPPMSYEQFTVRYPLGPPHPMHDMPPNHPDFRGPGPMPPHHREQDGFILSRAMDDVARRQDELMHREMEIQHRIEMAQRRFGGGDGPPPPSHRGGREEIRRFAVPRR